MDTTLPLDRLISQILKEHHLAQAYVNDMIEMFEGAESFNQPLNSWNVSNVTNMRHMFRGAESFNQPLNSWNVSNVNNRRGMFTGATLMQERNKPNFN